MLSLCVWYKKKAKRGNSNRQKDCENTEVVLWKLEREEMVPDEIFLKGESVAYYL